MDPARPMSGWRRFGSSEGSGLKLICCWSQSTLASAAGETVRRVRRADYGFDQIVDVATAVTLSAEP
jgi:hypothetical protein